jgi:hypothetical protein
MGSEEFDVETDHDGQSGHKQRSIDIKKNKVWFVTETGSHFSENSWRVIRNTSTL